MWSYLEGGYEVYSNLNTLNKIYSDLEALEDVFWKDYLDDSSCPDVDLEFVQNEALFEAFDLIYKVRKKYYGYKVILMYAKEHPEAKDECRDFYFPDGDYVV